MLGQLPTPSLPLCPPPLLLNIVPPAWLLLDSQTSYMSGLPGEVRSPEDKEPSRSRAASAAQPQNNPSSTLPHYTPHKQVTKAGIFKEENNFTPSVDRMGWECQQIYNICIMYTY